MIPIEHSRLALQTSLDVQKTQRERNFLGQFATPSALANDILEYAIRLMPKGSIVNFLDPAIGTGSFYAALRAAFPPHAIGRARGFEVDSHYGLPAIQLWKDTPLELEIADFTAAATPHHLQSSLCASSSFGSCGQDTFGRDGRETFRH